MDEEELNELSNNNDLAFQEPQNAVINNSEFQYNDLKTIFDRQRKGILIKDNKDNKGYIFYVKIKVNKEKKLTADDIKFKLDENSSILYCENITFLFYETDKYLEGIISFFFDGDVEPGKYFCYFDVFIYNIQLEDIKFKLYIEIPEQK